jgi:hypothetical protein
MTTQPQPRAPRDRSARTRPRRPYASQRGCGWAALCATAVALGLALSFAAVAQQPELLLTSATVARDSAGRDVAYVAWQETVPGLLRGRTYALYAKPGAPAAAGAFWRQAVLPPPDTAAAMAPLLAQAAQLGFDPSLLAEPLTALGATPGAAPAEQLAAIIGAAQSNPKLAEMLVLMAKAHPGVELALGQAWTGPIGAGETTFELREFDPRTGKDMATVARLAVAAGAAAPLPAPGAPVQVPDLTPTGDLLIKLRWASPPELRRRSALARGYNVWRLPKADADRLGWFAAPPSAAALAANARRVNSTPVTTARDFDAATVLNPADPDAHFVDDNGRFDDPKRAFDDGAVFAFIVTARDLIGRDGLASLAGAGRACHTVPPRVPTGLKVVNQHALADQPVAPDRQWFEASWAANPQAPPNHATHYELFRGTDLKDLEAPGGPPPASLIGTVPHVAGKPVLSFDDHSLVPEANYFGRTFWFAVRSRRDSACGPVYSALSPPVYGTLRKLAGPPAPTGAIDGNCPLPFVGWAAGRIAPERAPDDGLAHFRVACHRRGPGIVWAEFTVVVSRTGRQLDLGRFFFPDLLETLEADYTLSAAEADSH